MFLKFLINFLIYTKGGANFKKLEMVRCFISDFNSFLNFSCILEKKFLKKKEKKKEKINKKSYNGPARPLKIELPYITVIHIKTIMFK